MNVEEEHIIACPYCGESQTVLIDCTYDGQEYIEDCEVCCKPMTILVNYNENNAISLTVRHENE